MRWKIIVTGRERQRETIIVVTMIEGVKETTTGERGLIIMMIGAVTMIVMAGGVTTWNVAENDLLHENSSTRVTDEWVNLVGHRRIETGVITTTIAVTVVVITTTVVVRIWMIPGIIDETIAIVIVTIGVAGITTEGEVIEAEVAAGNAMNGIDAAETAVRLPLRKVTTS
jgi:hypothetical protein